MLIKSQPALLIFDLGLTNCKAVVFSARGIVLGQAAIAYPTHHPQPGHAEQNPADWWDAACRAATEILSANPELAGQIEAISVTGHMHALVNRSARRSFSAISGRWSRRAGWLLKSG
jgi:xylulokinase